jgi:hypothetical protein
MSLQVIGRPARYYLRQIWPRPHKAHIALDHVQELRQLIHGGGPQGTANGPSPGIRTRRTQQLLRKVPLGETDAEVLLSASEGAELVELE